MLNRFFSAPTVREVNVAQAMQDRTTRNAQIVDVREADEWASGHIPGAVHIPLGWLPGRVNELDPVKPTIVVCRSGNRSKTGADILTRAGFKETSSMAGGMIDWAKAGYPVER